jgi:hypothetical protein
MSSHWQLHRTQKQKHYRSKPQKALLLDIVQISNSSIHASLVAKKEYSIRTATFTRGREKIRHNCRKMSLINFITSCMEMNLFISEARASLIFSFFFKCYADKGLLIVYGNKFPRPKNIIECELLTFLLFSIFLFFFTSTTTLVSSRTKCHVMRDFFWLCLCIQQPTVC